MTLEVSGEVVFPRTITRDGYYTVRVPVTWSVVGSGVEDNAFGIAVIIFGVLKESGEIRDRSGSRTFDFQFSGSEVDFSRGADAIGVTVGGGVQCEGGSSDAASASITQIYHRHGGD